MRSYKKELLKESFNLVRNYYIIKTKPILEYFLKGLSMKTKYQNVQYDKG